MPPEISHKLAPYALKILSFFRKDQNYCWGDTRFRHLKFKNPLGIAGGLDKNAKNIKHWKKFGAGFLEIGTITLNSQKQNPGRVLLRKNKSLWNQLGFPNDGAEKVIKRLGYKLSIPLFINIGKNRNTPNETAKSEYSTLASLFLNHADAFVINVSSPNTKSLRSLSNPDKLSEILLEIKNVISKKDPSPIILVKLSPDLQDEELHSILDVEIADGWIVTNTTLNNKPPFPVGYGGVSGNMLKSKAKDILKQTVAYFEKNKRDKLIISSGGVMTPRDVLERLNLGANLVQVYSGLVFYGLNFFKDTKNLHKHQ